MPPEETTEPNDYERLLAKHGHGLNREQQGIVYGLAYQYGHSAGEHEVEMYYDELADMARELLAANKAS